jgi:hypothetical protein
MNTGKMVFALLFLALAGGVARAQNDAGQQPAAGNDQQAPADNSQGAPNPAFGQNNPPPQSGENPPLSGLDQPSLEPQAAARSFLQPGAHISESVDSNLANDFGKSTVRGVTRVAGSLLLERYWSHYETALDYIGGAAFYSNFHRRTSQIQQLDAEQRIAWRRGQMVLRDSFSYLPEGSFGFGAFGGVGAYQSGLGGIGPIGGGVPGGAVGGIFGPGQFGSLGQTPRISNSAVADITESLSPRSSVTAAGGYGLVHFTDNNPLGFIDSRQFTAQAGYNYQFNRRDQGAVVYGFQEFRYPYIAGSSFTTHMVHVLYGHRISGRMDLVLGGGPQWTIINNPLFGKDNRLSLSGRASLRYHFPHSTVGLFYEHHNTSGSGFFLGANTDVARVSLNRPLGRLWQLTADVGYSHNNRIEPAIAGISARTYQYAYVGGAAQRQLGRQFSLFLSYQFNDLLFDSSFCGSGPCNRISQRHVAAVGLDWHPHPIRLD